MNDTVNTTAPDATQSAGQPAVATQPAAPIEGQPIQPQAFAWPDGWRSQMAGGDEKEAARLERFKEPKDIYNSYRQFENKLAKGELKMQAPYPDKGTPEDQAHWRKSNGIPDAPDKYDIKLKAGYVLGEEDKPLVDGFLKHAHTGNMKPEDVNTALNWYYDSMRESQETRGTLDNQVAQQSEDKLRQEWGQDFRPNMNAINNLLSSESQGLRETITNARGPDGTPLASNPEVLNFLAKMARETNPMSTLIPMGENPSSIENELSALRSKMADQNSEYWKGPNADKNQERFRRLLSAQSKGK